MPTDPTRLLADACRAARPLLLRFGYSTQQIDEAIAAYDAASEVSTAADCRTGGVMTRPTATDYDTLIADLEAAKSQLVPDGDNCHVCGDGGHQAWQCHHNPLVLLRRAEAELNSWRCYHCGYVAKTHEDAVAHFGANEEATAACRKDSAKPTAPLDLDRLTELEALLHETRVDAKYADHWEVGGPFPSVSVIVMVDGGSGGECPEPPIYEPVCNIHDAVGDCETPPPRIAVAVAELIVELHNAAPALLVAAHREEKMREALNIAIHEATIWWRGWRMANSMGDEISYEEAERQMRERVEQLASKALAKGVE